MKLRTRLIISFLIIIIVPIAISAIVIALSLSGYPNTPVTSEVRKLLGEYENKLLIPLVIDVVITAVLIMIFTAAALFSWIYPSVFYRISRLKDAANDIKSGNLDTEIKVSGNDEIGELAQSFEEMRVRLKRGSEQKLESEQQHRELISNLAHDLKTPITAIKGYSEGIIDGMASTPEKLNSYMTTIRDKADELDLLLGKLTVYSQLDMGSATYSLKKLKAMQFFDDIAIRVGVDIEHEGMEFVYNNSVGEDVEFVADEMMLTRAIRNIIDNAIKYRDFKKQSKVEMHVRDAFEKIDITILDNGIGVDEKELGHIFDRLYRVDRSRNSDIAGSGIGLSIVKKVVEDIGGEVSATSELGQWTSITLSFNKYGVSYE